MRKPWLIVSVLLLALVTLLLWWPIPAYELAKVHPALRDLPKPYRSVRAAYYMDGGSVGVEVIGADGTIRQFAFPVHERTNRGSSHPQMFIGGMHIRRKSGATPLTEITDSPDTRAMLIRLIEDHAEYSGDRCQALFQLRQAPKDLVSLAIYALWGKNHSNGQ